VTNWVIEAMPKTSMPATSFALPGLAERHDHPGKTCLLGHQSGGQDATDWPHSAVQPQLAQQDRSAPVRRRERSLALRGSPPRSQGQSARKAIPRNRARALRPTDDGPGLRPSNSSTKGWIIRVNVFPRGEVSPRRDLSVVATATAYLHRLIGVAVIPSPLVPTN
jgi:hypothetical protein